MTCREATGRQLQRNPYRNILNLGTVQLWGACQERKNPQNYGEYLVSMGKTGNGCGIWQQLHGSQRNLRMNFFFLMHVYKFEYNCIFWVW